MLWLPTFPNGASVETMRSVSLAGNRGCVIKNVGLTLVWIEVPAGTRSLAVAAHNPEGRDDSGRGAVAWPPGKLAILLRLMSPRKKKTRSCSMTGSNRAQKPETT